MNNLSSAAQAVLNAITEISPAPADEIASTALRAAADQMSTHHSKTFLYSIADYWKLQSIADELESVQ